MRVTGAFLAAVLGGFLYWCFWNRVPEPRTTPAVPRPLAATPATAREELTTLTVARSRDAASYQREAFGPGWSGEGAYPTLPDGCTARDDVLRRDLSAVRTAGLCLVVSGFLIDPYTGAQLPYTRYAPSHIQIDHVVALGVAWRSGASRWSPEKRREFANDIDDLLAVQASANQDKSSKTPDQWRPRKGYWCAYATRWVTIKHRYALTVTPAEKASLSGMLADCASDPDHRPGALPGMR